jgi:hypothetical protein
LKTSLNPNLEIDIPPIFENPTTVFKKIKM